MVEALVQLIREEIALAIHDRQNWKIILHGSAAGDVSLVRERYRNVVTRGLPIAPRE